jgi:Tol biopolymer transport system component
MKKIILYIAMLGIASLGLKAQDRFSVKQLTFDPAQQGFPTWSPDGEFIIYQHSDMYDTLGMNGLWRIFPDGSGATHIFNELAEHPKWSPDGSLVVFDADTGNSIKMVPAEGGDPIVFLPDSIHIRNGGLPCWSPDGTQIAFLEAAGLSICVYNAKKVQISSIFRKDGMLPMPGGWTPGGKSLLVALMDRQTRKSTLWLISSDGKEKTQITGHHENFYRHLALSPDGSLLVYGVYEEGNMGLYVMPFLGGPSLPLIVSEQASNGGPSWSPDGKKLAFTSTRSGSFDVWIMNVNMPQLKRDLRIAE